MVVYKMKMGETAQLQKIRTPFLLGGKKKSTKTDGSPQDGAFIKTITGKIGRPLWRPDSDVDGAPNPATPHPVKSQGHGAMLRLCIESSTR